MADGFFSFFLQTSGPFRARARFLPPSFFGLMTVVIVRESALCARGRGRCRCAAAAVAWRRAFESERLIKKLFTREREREREREKESRGEGTDLRREISQQRVAVD